MRSDNKYRSPLREEIPQEISNTVASCSPYVEEIAEMVDVDHKMFVEKDAGKRGKGIVKMKMHAQTGSSEDAALLLKRIWKKIKKRHFRYDEKSDGKPDMDHEMVIEKDAGKRGKEFFFRGEDELRIIDLVLNAAGKSKI